MTSGKLGIWDVVEVATTRREEEGTKVNWFSLLDQAQTFSVTTLLLSTN